MATAYQTIAELYHRTHGIRAAEIEPMAMSAEPLDRLRFWEEFWRELGFAGARPTGSSRLMEVAVAQSRAGDPGELLRALFVVLGDAREPTEVLAYFARLLWVETRANGVALPGTRDSFLPLPAVLSGAQAALVLQFVDDRSRYTHDDHAKLRDAQAIAPQYGLTVEDVFGTPDLVHHDNTPKDISR